MGHKEHRADRLSWLHWEKMLSCGVFRTVEFS